MNSVVLLIAVVLMWVGVIAGLCGRIWLRWTSSRDILQLAGTLFVTIGYIHL